MFLWFRSPRHKVIDMVVRDFLVIFIYELSISCFTPSATFRSPLSTQHQLLYILATHQIYLVSLLSLILLNFPMTKPSN